MTIEEFKNSFEGKEPPVCLSLDQKVLWYVGKEEWHKAHELIHLGSGKDCSLIHAFIHRKDGEIQKSDLWYSKAGSMRPDCSVEEEYEKILKEMFI